MQLVFKFMCFLFLFLKMSSEEEEAVQDEAIPTQSEVAAWTVPTLKAWLEERGLARSGKKETLVNRVCRSVPGKSLALYCSVHCNAKSGCARLKVDSS